MRSEDKIITEALLNGKMTNLELDEAIKADKFHRNRFAFAWIDGKLTFNKLGDSRDHQHWLTEDFGLTLQEFEETPRGYIKEGRIQLFKGSDFRKIDIDKDLTDFKSDKESLVKAHNKLFEGVTPEIFNGVKIGKVGEIWPPIEKIG